MPNAPTKPTTPKKSPVVKTKATKKPATDAKPGRAKSTDAKMQKSITVKVNKAVGVEKLDAGGREIYTANEKAIDLALHRCLSHFGKLRPSEVQVVIKLLKDNYIEYGGHYTSGGFR